ncbi:MAG TPA: F0F1 ATP synthase subunit delta [Gammaproteobacteria bacterium]|nr:F0F1 ATP synthase subunit delta [Gammaproteobacteria bacterium]
MADFETAARPYARAIFELASEESKLEQWQERLQGAAAIAVDEQMQAMVDMPSMLASDLAGLFLSVAEGAGIETDDDFKNLVMLLAENDRLAALPAISEAFEVLKRDAEGKIEVRVRSAQELTDKQQQKIADSMAKRLGKEVNITTEIDESLIAGAIVTAGDLVIDGSVSGRMGKLSLALSK